MSTYHKEVASATVEQTIIQGRVINPSQVDSSTPLFADWAHSSLQITSAPPNYPPEPVILPHLTEITSGVAVMCIPSLLQPPHLRGSPAIHCWTQSNTESTANPQQEIAKAIVMQYQKCMPRITLVARVNPTINDFKSSLDRLKSVKGNRFLFHYTSHGATDISSQFLVLHSADKTTFDFFPIENVLSVTSTCGVHIIDCDCAGTLLPTYANFVTERKENSIETDLFAFFSCGAREKLPRSPGLPSDIFSSCMTTPARMALLWHSRHYYCFKNGPLCPLNINFFENTPSSIINEISLVLHRFVEAMACEVFPPDLFMKVFRSDSSLAHLASNFFLAARIMSFFGITPLSLPAMPDLRNHQLWYSFDLRLDVALLQLNSPSPAPSLTYSAFLEQSLQTLRHLTSVSTKDISFPSQLTLIPPVIRTPSLQADGCEVLAQYVDKSIGALKQIWYFPIIKPLFSLLPNKIGGDYLLLCITKILCFFPAARSIFASLTDQSGQKLKTFSELLGPLFKCDKPLFPLIISTITVKENPPIIEELKEIWTELVLPLLDHKHNDIRLWTLLFISQFIESMDNKDVVFEPIMKLLSDDSPEIRITALYTCCFFANTKNAGQILETASKLCTDPNPMVRLQLVVTLSKFASNPIKDSVFSILKSDPYPEIHRQLQLENSDQRSYVFEWLCSSILSPIKTLIEHPELTMNDVQPTAIKTARTNISPPTGVVFQKIQMGPTIISDNPITSNFASTNSGQLLFGTKMGEIALCNWGEQKKPVYRRFTNHSINHVQHISNRGYPLTLASNSDGYIYIMQFNDTEMGLASCFKAGDSEFHFECDEYSRKLFTYNGEKTETVMIYDLNKEKMVGGLVPTNGAPKSVRALPRLSDVVAVAGEQLELFDLRAGPKSVLTFEDGPPAFDVGTIASSPTQFALGHTTACVSLLDARLTEPISRFQIVKEDYPTLSFAVQSECCSAAIGNAKGLFMIDLNSGKKLEFTVVSQLFFSSKKVQAVSQCIFHPRRFRLSILQESNEVMTLIEDS